MSLGKNVVESVLRTTAYGGKRILITGASGFIGTHLTLALIQQGAQIAALDQRPSESPVQPLAEYVGDLRDASFVERCLLDVMPEVIFHLAAFKERSSGVESFRDAIDVNLTGTLNLLTAAKGVESLQAMVVLGTAEEYGRNDSPFKEGMREAPVSAYSFSKLCVTQLCQIMHARYGLPCVVLRPTIAYGPGQAVDMFLPALIQTLIAGRKFPMTKGEQTRDYIFITDLVVAMLLAGTTRQAQGHIINLGSGHSVTIADLAFRVERLLGKQELIILGALPYRPGEIMKYGVDIDRAHSLLGWEAVVSLEQGLQQTIAHYSHGKNK